MFILAFLAQKGGSGKTTLAIHLAGCALKQGMKTALLDTDPQRSMAVWAERRKLSEPWVGGQDNPSIKNAIQSAQQQSYQLLILDTPPQVNTRVREVAKQANLVIIPSRPALLDLHAIEPSIAVVHNLNQSCAMVLNGCPPPRKGTKKHAIVEEAHGWLKDYQLPVYPLEISNRAAFSHALINGQTILEYEPHGKAANEINAFWTWLQHLMKESQRL